MAEPTHITGIVQQVAFFGVAAVQLGWTGLVAGTSTVAVAVDALGGARHRRVAASAADAVRADLLALGWLEAGAIALLVLGRIRHPFFPASAPFWAAVFGALVGGFTLLGYFRSALAADRQPGLRTLAGLGGISLVVASGALLCLGSGSLLQPWEWATVEPWFRVLITWSGAGRFGEFTLVSFAATGAAIVAVGRRLEGAEDRRFSRRLGSGLSLMALLALPAPLLLSHAFLPRIAHSPITWGFAAAALLVAGAGAWLATRGLPGAAEASSGVLPVSLALLALLVAGEQAARERALVAPVLAGLTVPAVPPAVAPPRAPSGGPPAAPATPAAAPSVSAGKAVFDRLCHLCHRFDKRLVGPPLDAVIPKYRKDPKALEAFIRDPVKKDPAYPKMPKPAVSEAEIQAVAAWMLSEVKP